MNDDGLSPLAARLLDELGERPRFFAELVELHPEVPWPEFLRAWGQVRSHPRLGRRENGLYLVRPEPGPA